MKKVFKELQKKSAIFLELIKVIFKYYSFLENLDEVKHNGEEMIKIGPFLTDLWTFEVD